MRSLLVLGVYNHYAGEMIFIYSCLRRYEVLFSSTGLFFDGLEEKPL